MLYQRDPDINVLKENGGIFLSHGIVQMSTDSPGLVGFSASTQDFDLGFTRWRLRASRKGEEENEGQVFLFRDVTRKLSTSFPLVSHWSGFTHGHT